MNKRVLLIFCLLFALMNIKPVLAAKIKGVVVQANVSQLQFEHALKLAANMHSVLKHTKFEVVVFGPIVKWLTPLSVEEPLIQTVQGEGIKVIACGRSLKTDHVKKSDLDPGITVVPFGAVYIMQRESEGWAYFKP